MEYFKPFTMIFAMMVVFFGFIILSRASNDESMINKLLNDNTILANELRTTEKERLTTEQEILILSGRVSELALRYAMTLEQESNLLYKTVCELSEILKNHGVDRK